MPNLDFAKVLLLFKHTGFAQIQTNPKRDFIAAYIKKIHNAEGSPI